MSKIIISFALAAATLTAPVLGFAQSSGPLTRAEVRADLVRVEKAGYNPSTPDDTTYPADIQAAEAKIAAQTNQKLTTQAGVGAVESGSASSGAAMQMSSICAGPVSVCNVYYGS